MVTKDDKKMPNEIEVGQHLFNIITLLLNEIGLYFLS